MVQDPTSEQTAAYSDPLLEDSSIKLWAKTEPLSKTKPSLQVLSEEIAGQVFVRYEGGSTCIVIDNEELDEVIKALRRIDRCKRKILDKRWAVK